LGRKPTPTYSPSHLLKTGLRLVNIEKHKKKNTTSEYGKGRKDVAVKRKKN